jgi:hypothetical protein
MSTATINKNEIAVVYTNRTDVGREYLTIDVPNGWDDVEKITKKVLTYEDKKFVFTGWNSDTLKCYFVRSNQFATISSLRRSLDIL